MARVLRETVDEAIEGPLTLRMRPGSRVLTVAFQRVNQRISLWYLEPPAESVERIVERRFVIYPTGCNILKNMSALKHVATFQIAEPGEAWHAFELIS